MTRSRTKTEQAMGKLQEAGRERRDHPACNLAPMYERQANELLALAEAPAVGPGGEVIERRTPNESTSRAIIRETLVDGANAIAADASARRTDLLLQPSFNAVALGLDAAQAIDAGNSMEKMLAHQMAVAHEASMRLMDRALSYEANRRTMNGNDSVEACRLVNASARLMSVFQDGLLTLQRLRSGGSQTVTVQHVNVVQPGAQAVIGTVEIGGRGRRRGTK